MSTRILAKVKEFNDVCLSSTVSYAKSEVLILGQVADENNISVLESKIGTKIPGDLRSFYRSIGGLACKPISEYNSITIFSPDYLIENLDRSHIFGIQGLGLLEMVLYNWGNDRIEITELPEVTKTYINDNYFCFGWYIIDDILESINYLYFDREGRFGAAFCREANFVTFIHEYINPLMQSSLATDAFEDLMVDSLNKIIELKRKELY